MRKKTIFTFVLGLALGVGGSWCYFANSHQWWPFGGDTGWVGPRTDRWATRIDNHAVKNLHKVSDSLYRGVQPDLVDYIREMDVEKLRANVNVSPATRSAE